MLELKAKPRSILGKKVKNLRREDFLPAVVYGAGVDSLPIVVPYTDFERVYRKAGESSLLKLNLDGKVRAVLIHDVSRDPLRGSFLHADFYAVRMDRPLSVRVPFEFIGESPAVKNEHGILVKVMHEIEIEALPHDLPSHIQVDLSKLNSLESKIFVKDLILPPGVKAVAEADEIVVLVETPRSEEELAELEKSPEDYGVVGEVKTEREAKLEKERIQNEAAGENAS